MKAFDKPSIYLWLRLAYDNHFERRPWHIKNRNDYHQMGDKYSYLWRNEFIDKNSIKKKI